MKEIGMISWSMRGNICFPTYDVIIRIFRTRLIHGSLLSVASVKRPSRYPRRRVVRDSCRPRHDSDWTVMRLLELPNSGVCHPMSWTHVESR